MRALLLILATTMVRCSSAEPPHDVVAMDSDTVTLTNIPTFCTRVVHAEIVATCGYRGRCCTLAEQDVFNPLIETAPIPFACDSGTEADWIAQCVQRFDPAAFDEIGAGRCATAIESETPNQYCNGPDPFFGQANSVSAACDFARTNSDGGCTSGCAGGNGQIDAPCAIDSDCAHDSYCFAATSGAGRCRYRESNGESCATDGYGSGAAVDCRGRDCDGHICLARCIGASRPHQ